MSELGNVLRARIAEGRVVGTFPKLAATETIDLAAAHLDFAVVDLEHSQLDDGSAGRLVRHARALGFPAVVRVAWPERERINRLLEAGAAGIQLSTVRRAESVRRLRHAMSYAPHGARSISLGQPAAGYGAVELRSFLDAQGDGALLVAQIETAITDDPLPQIAAERPDVLFIGPMDLTVDLRQDRDRVKARIDEIIAVAADAGIALGGAGVQAPAIRYDVIGSDIAMLRAGFARTAVNPVTSP